MNNFKKALIICRAKVKETKKTYRIIREGNNYLIVSDKDYQAAYKKHCDSLESEMRLIFTREYYNNADLKFDAACIIAESKAEKTGQTWHVVKIGNFYTEVHEHFFIARPEIESLAKFENIT